MFNDFKYLTTEQKNIITQGNYDFIYLFFTFTIETKLMSKTINKNSNGLDQKIVLW